MKISFARTKHCRCYENYVCNPENRDHVKKFKKHFPMEIMEAATKLHQRLINQPNILAFNNTYGTSKNGIEFVSGISKKDPLLLKVRVTGSYRKFFNAYSNCNEDKLITKSNWTDNPEDIKNVFVTDINKHNYQNI